MERDNVSIHAPVQAGDLFYQIVKLVVSVSIHAPVQAGDFEHSIKAWFDIHVSIHAPVQAGDGI